MKKGTRFLIGLAAAGLTFGACMLMAGPEQFNKYGKHSCNGNYYHHCHASDAGVDIEHK